MAFLFNFAFFFDFASWPRGLERDMLVLVEVKVNLYPYRIMAVFGKSYNKWYMPLQKSYNKWYMSHPNDPPVIWNKDGQPNVIVSLERMKKRRVSDKDLYIPVRSTKNYTYIVKWVGDVRRVIGSLHEDK